MLNYKEAQSNLFLSTYM